jgi:hypothetical protein
VADSDFIIEILTRLRDEASPGLARLKAEINSFKGTQDAERAERNLGNAIKGTGEEADRSKRKHEGLRTEQERSRRAADDAGRGVRSLSEDLERSRAAHERASSGVSGHTKTQQDFADALAKVKQESRDTSDGVEDLHLRMSKLRTSWVNFDNQLKNGELTKGQAKRGIREYVDEFENISKKLERGTEEWRNWGREADNIAKKLKSSDLGASGGFLSSLKRGDLENVLQNIGAKFDDLGLRITGVASFLQGFFDLAKIGFSQQLITGIASLAGGLFSVASAATQAGAALAGAFVSGLGQAIPMLSIVVASLERFKTILQAVSVAGQAEQQHFFNPAEKQILQLQQTSQLISANQQLSNSHIQLFEAQQRVRDSQIALTEARYTAQRQITELALAEKNARLQAEGATISLTESKRQLQIAIQRGDVAGLQQAELAVKEAELNKKKVDFEIPKTEREARLVRERGVGGAPAVISAVRGLEGSRLAVVQAQQGAEAARRQKQILDLQRQARSSKETQYESQLKFLEKGMSPTELGLTNALIGLEKELKSPSSPLKKITDYIVEPFTRAIVRVQSLLKNASFLKPISDLAKSMGGGLGKIEQTIFGVSGTKFFENMAKLAAKNVPIISNSLVHLIHIFEHIAKAAGPAFTKLSEDWNKFWSALDTRQHSTSGFERLEKFFNKSVEYAESFGKLGAALFDLFKALGSDAAPQGLLTVTSFTEAIKDATNWVEGHKTSVTNFFKEAREGLSVLGQLLFGIGKSLIEVFSLSSLKAFSQFMQQIILPALRDVVKLLGFLTKLLLEVANAIPGGKAVLEGLAGAFLGLEIIGKFAGPIYKTVKALNALYKAAKALVLLEGFGKAWADAKIAFSGAGDAAAGAAKKVDSLTGAESISAGAAEADAAAQSGLAAGETAAGGGLLTRLGLGGAAGVASKALLPLGVAAGTLYGLRELAPAETSKKAFGLPVGFSAGQQIPTGLSMLNPFSGHFLSPSYEESKEKIGKFGKEVENLRNKISSLPKAKLEGIQHEAEKLAEDPSLSKYKGSLQEVAKAFSPSEVSAKQWYYHLKEYMEGLNPVVRGVAESFRSVNESTQFIFKNVKEIVKTNIESIKEDLGLNSKIGKEALAKNFGEAETTIYQAMGKGTVSTKKGMEEIRKLVSESLKKYGVSNTEIETSRNAPFTHLQKPSLAASGAYVAATPGGKIMRTAEAGHDEVILSTDPRYAQRSRQLLGQYFSRAPHMAVGGFVADSGTNFSVGMEPKIVTELQKLGEYLHTTIYGISGYRTPQHSVEVGGFANDPHTRGEAVDVGVGSNTLASAARLSAGLLAKFGLYRPFYPASAHEINHIQLLPGFGPGIRGSMAQYGGQGQNIERQIQKIKAPKIRGGGVIGNVAQKALDLATKAANIYLSKFSSPMGEVLGNIHLSGGNVGKKVMNFFSPLVGRIASAGMIGNFEQESALNPNAPGGGLDQGQGARDHSRLSLAGQLAAIWSELTGSERGTLAALRRAKSAAEAARIFSERFERPGIPMLSNRERYAEEALRSFDIGGIAPWGGRPVPIIAHEGERIMNPAQYSATARLAGTSPRGLDNYLGYDGSPRQSFADGGPVVTRRYRQPNSVEVNAGLIDQFKNIIFEIGSIGNILKSFDKVKIAFSKLRKSSGDSFVRNLEKIINEIIIETNGVLARLQEGREFFKARIERKSVESEYTKKEGKIQLGSRGQIGIAEFSEQNLAEESKYLQTERNIIDKTIAETKRLKPKNQKEANAKSQALKVLALKQKELGEAIDQNIEARYQAETQVIQARLTEINNQYQVISQEQQTKISKAQSFGNLEEAGQLEEQSAASAQAQISKLMPMLEQAQNIGNKELETSIKQEINSLQQAINSTVIERISNAQTLIQRESAQAESKAGMRLGIAKVLQAEGKYESANREEEAGLQEKQANLLSTKAKDEALREQAAREGDTAAVITLGEELNKNSVEIAENNLALKNNVVATRELILSQIGRETGVGTGIYGAFKSGIEILGKTTGFTNVAALISAVKGEQAILSAGESKYEEQGTGLGFQTIGMTSQQVLQYLTSPEAQSIISRIEATGTEAEKADLEKWLSGIEGNSVAILKNNEELARLNGQLNQPQSWSTAAFNSFRTSFFTGMGGLLEPYSAALPPGMRPEGLPQYGSGNVGAPVHTTNIENLNVPHPVEVADPALFAEELSYHISTTPPTS